jgi:hypothetical protein
MTMKESKMIFSRFVLGIFCAIIYVSSAHASILRLGVCKTKMDGTDVEVDFFAKSQNEGYYIQKIADLKLNGSLEIKDAGDHRELKMAVVGDKKALFGTLNLPKELHDSSVDIYAVNFKQNWGTFTCNP